ncbi:MAG TPA: hypothetical protein VMU89_04375 [Thermomicrobiaceae bacterium]|nr:hypothetical protein [Thermomicrobiaceae bacterium]
MDDDPLLFGDLAPIRLRTSLLTEIERLSEERRRLLRMVPELHRQREVRLRLSEINGELEGLWRERRRELGRPVIAAAGAEAAG